MAPSSTQQTFPIAHPATADEIAATAEAVLREVGNALNLELTNLHASVLFEPQNCEWLCGDLANQIDDERPLADEIVQRLRVPLHEAIAAVLTERAYVVPTDRHPSDAELCALLACLATRHHLQPADYGRIRNHVAVCAECAERFALIDVKQAGAA